MYVGFQQILLHDIAQNNANSTNICRNYDAQLATARNKVEPALAVYLGACVAMIRNSEALLETQSCINSLDVVASES
jgi:hypothetical protein